jgi:hypothetical protein
MAKLNYCGVPVYMNGKNYYIPSLSTRDFMQHEVDLVSVVEGETGAQHIQRLMPVIGLAVRRNYPDLTDEQLMEMLDVHTYILAVRAVSNASGMEWVAEGE